MVSGNLAYLLPPCFTIFLVLQKIIYGGTQQSAFSMSFRQFLDMLKFEKQWPTAIWLIIVKTQLHEFPFISQQAVLF